jgi:hypothetical protein
MLFWILLTLLIIGMIINSILWIRVGYAINALLTDLIVLIIGGMVVVLLPMFLTSAFTPEKTTTSHEYELRALGAGESASGRFYLGTGYINGERVINYTYSDESNGATFSKVDSAPGDDSRIFEDVPVDAQPSVTSRKTVYTYPLLVPWSMGLTRTWDFHVPAGSIIEDYEIKN